jgi:acetolactate synthase regulatory subunit
VRHLFAMMHIKPLKAEVNIEFIVSSFGLIQILDDQIETVAQVLRMSLFRL